MLSLARVAGRLNSVGGEQFQLLHQKLSSTKMVPLGKQETNPVQLCAYNCLMATDPQIGKISRSDRENLSVVNGAAALILNLRGFKTK